MRNLLILSVLLLFPVIASADEPEKVSITLSKSTQSTLAWVAGAASVGLAAWAAIGALKKYGVTLPQIATPVSPANTDNTKTNTITKSQRVQEIVAKVLQLSAVDDEDSDLISMDLTVNRKSKPPMKFSVDLGDEGETPTKTSTSK